MQQSEENLFKKNCWIYIRTSTLKSPHSHSQILSSVIALKIGRLATMVVVKNNSFSVAPWRVEWIWSPWTALSSENTSLFNLSYSSLEKPCSQCLSLFDLTQSSLNDKSLIFSGFVKNNYWLLFNITIAWDPNTCWDKQEVE